MVSLDIILQMQQQGMTDYEISKTLQSQGVSPREINEALNQAKIKNALNNSGTSGAVPQTQNYDTQPVVSSAPQASQPGFSTPTVVSNPMPQPTQPQAQASIMPVPQQQQSYPVDNQYATQDPYAQSSSSYPDQGYNDGYYDDGYYDDYGDESVSEIAEQVVNEKFREFTSKTGDLVTFKNTVEDHIRSLDQRITRIENTIDKLQQSIIQKIGEFGESTTMIRRDLENLHNTTSKLMNPLIDNYRELEKRK